MLHVETSDNLKCSYSDEEPGDKEVPPSWFWQNEVRFSAEMQAYNTKPRDNTKVDAIDNIRIERNLVPRKPSSGLKKSWANGWAEIKKKKLHDQQPYCW